MRKAVLFDLDGTLLPMDMDEFIQLYYKEIQESGIADVFHKSKGMDMFSAAIAYMMGEHGDLTNEEAFCSKAEDLSGLKRDKFLPIFEDFYKNRFKILKSTVKEEPLVKDILNELKRKDYTLILATNPYFPRIATDTRINWAGLSCDDFSYVTYYENSRYSKPNLKYFEEVLDNTGFKASECYMVGNSVEEDLCAVKMGFEAFFLTDYSVGDIAQAPECMSGSYMDLYDWAKSLPEVRE